ncbi:translational GTPase TypA [Buchnera aphidicola (Taiwanaphis decaspermi)]|uniref:translational GTPase TypA n=1 Tax=Buchnera aphidicola TaxID=9 RepID=UPI0031B8A39D
MKRKIKNIAIIAHIDHGKTTLIDKLLHESGVLKKNTELSERIMDSNDLEKEKGITILSKNTAIKWNDYHINIIDTPGHSDFGGEVERVMSMVDSALLLVDAVDGPMTQTRFVTKKAFENNVKVLLVINKIDRENARPDWVINQVFDLFANLNATEEQLDFPVIYTSALLGKSSLDYNNMKNNMKPLLDFIIKNSPYPNSNEKSFFKMQISQLEYNNYLGVIGIGKIHSGIVKCNQKVTVLGKKYIYNSKINKILIYLGLKKIEKKIAYAGDIIALTGIEKLNISDTICDPNNLKKMPVINIESPTVKMFFCVNSSPFAGKDGKYITSRSIMNRLHKETINNVSLKIEETNNSNMFLVCGRGELHLSILIENMRREGFELEVSRPKVIYKTINNIKKEPFENLFIEINEKYQGIIMQYMGERKAKIKNITQDNFGIVRIDYIISSKALIGFHSHFMNITSGSGIMHSSFSHYDSITTKKIGERQKGVIISNGNGMAVAFALFNLQDRGQLFISHGEQVYEGQIIGVHNRQNDLTVNCLTGKKLTNMRASGTDESVILTKPIKINLEFALSFINDDELVEITPKAIRLRKKEIKEKNRKIFNRKKNNKK